MWVCKFVDEVVIMSVLAPLNGLKINSFLHHLIEWTGGREREVGGGRTSPLIMQASFTHLISLS